MRLLVYDHFGLPPDPWAELDIATADAVRATALVNAAVQAHAFVSLVGPRGAGKTCAVRRALHDGVKVVEPLRLQRERLHLGDIETAIVRDLSDERPRRSAEARTGQVRRILRTAATRHNVVLLIDDAHVLHHATLRGLKRLRELGAANRRGVLLGVVLVGQSDRTEQAAEVRLRSDRLHFAGLTVAEAKAAVEAVLNGDRTRIDLDALDVLAGADRARNWLDLEALVDDCLAAAMERGASAVDSGCVGAVLGPAKGGARRPKAPQAARHAALDGVLEAVG